MRISRKALSLFIALTLAAVAAFGLIAACSGGDREGNKTGEGGSNVTYVFGTTEGIELDKDSVSIRVDEKASVKATIKTSGNRTSDFVSWTSSDDGVATVSSGVVTGIGPGRATITASIEGTGYFASCLVTVTNGETLTVGVKDDVKNFGYYDYVTRSYTGMEIDLAYMIADELFYDGVELVTVNPEDREIDLQEEKVDMIIATYSITEERQQLVHFSSAYYKDSVQILLNQDYSEMSGLVSLKDVSEYVGDRNTFSLATTSGSTAYGAFFDYCKDEGITATSPFVDGGNIFVNESFEDYEACWEALVAGEADAFVADHSILQSYAEGSSKYRFLTDEFSEQQYGVATALGSDLSVLVDEVVERFLSDGTMEVLLASYGLA